MISAVLLLFILPVEPPVIQCDQLELNSVYDDDGRLWLKQVIFWRWDSTHGWVAEGWQRADCGMIRRTPRGWRWESPWRVVESRTFIRTHSQYDREAENRAGKRWGW